MLFRSGVEFYFTFSFIWNKLDLLGLLKEILCFYNYLSDKKMGRTMTLHTILLVVLRGKDISNNITNVLKMFPQDV